MFIFFSHLTVCAESPWIPVETVVAVVDRTPLLDSDLDLAAILGLAGASPAEEPETLRSTLLDSRIRLEVQFRDLEASGVLYRLELDVPGVKRSLLDAVGGPAAVADDLAAAGLDDADVTELALRICAVNAFAEQRLRPRVSVSLAEIEAAYQSLTAEVRGAGQEPPSLTAIQEQLHQLVAERKLNDEIERWVERAMAEHEVMRFTR